MNTHEIPKFKPTKNVNPQSGLNFTRSMTDKEMNPSPEGTDSNLHRFKIHYFKTKQIELETLEKEFVSTMEDNHHQYNAFQIQNLQSYNPLYSKFFELTETNYNRISLNHKYHISNLSTIFDQETKETLKKPVFIKFSPLLDPVRYMIGKYKQDDLSIRTLPTLTTQPTEQLPHSKIMDPNNVSYVDNFFSFLTSKLLHTHHFLNGVDYYGSYMGIQDKFKMNVTDDLEYLNTSSYFLENKDNLFSVTGAEISGFTNFGSRANKNKLQINKSSHNITVESLIDLDENVDIVQTEIQSIQSLTEDALESALVYDKHSSYKSTDSSNSSTDSSANSETNYSTTDEEEDEENNSKDDNSRTDDEDDDSSWESVESSVSSIEETQFAFIRKFPVQLICLEKCDGTLDYLFENEKINIDEAASSLFQIIMTLIAYQKAFHFTHNDLHTNNIMYINTDIEYLYYRNQNKTYKVPTYGKIYKIIDFGRSIYRFNGHIFCSDSFAPGGDAATQYNCEPYMNENKPRLDPNYSFDLARLGCSLYDFIIDDDSSQNKFDELQKTIYRWCTDDNQKNILYKQQ